jgi:hypothetical protein
VATIPQRIRRPSPHKGLSVAKPSDELEPEFSPRALNVRFVFSTVRQGPGRSLLAGTHPGDPVRRIGRFSRVDGLTWPFMLTDTGLFRWGNLALATPRQWHRVAGPVLGNPGKIYDFTTGEDRLFFTRFDQSVSSFYAWDGQASSPYAVIVPSSGVAPPCKFVEYFNDRPVVAHTFEGGQILTNRLRWPVSGDHLNWSGTGSGFLDVYAPEEQPITGIKNIGGRLAVYRRHSIGDLIPTGTTIPVHQFEVRVSGMGTAAPWTIASNGQQHFFLGQDNSVYSWDGVNLTNVGEPVQDILRDIINQELLEQYFGFVILDTREYWLVLTTGDAFVYNYVYNTWSRDTYGNITAAGEVLDSTGLDTWATAQGTWDAYPGSWADASGTQLSRVFAGRSDGGTFVIDQQVAYDYYTIGSIVDRYAETPDMYFPAPATAQSADQPDVWEEGTPQRAIIIYDPVRTTTPFLFGVSFDRGQTWSEQSITPNGMGLSIAEYNLTGPHVRYRFRENIANASFRWSSFSYEFIPAGPHNPL